MSKARLDFARLPPVTFVTPDAENTVALGGCLADIAARARVLSTLHTPGAAVGLVFRSGPALVLNWLACLAARLEPLVMQYPTEKQTREYWETSVRHTTQLAGLQVILAEDAVAARIDGMGTAVIRGSELETGDARGRSEATPVDGEFSIPSYAPQWLESVGDFECLLVIGAQGPLTTDKPAVAPMWFRENRSFMANVADADLQSLEFQQQVHDTSPHAFYGVAVDREEGRELRNAIRRARRQREGKRGRAARDNR